MQTFSARDVLGLKIIGLTSCGLTVLLLAAFWLTHTRPRVDAESLCPLDLPHAQTAILIDKTDPLTEKQKDEVSNLIKSIQPRLDLYEQLSIFKLDDMASVSRLPVFSLCNPGQTASSALYQNPAMVEKRFHKKFGQVLEGLIPTLVEGQVSPVSPILEMIQTISRSREFSPQSTKRTLIVISDLLQNVPAFSHYAKAIEPYGSYKASTYYATVSASLEGVHVEVYQVPRVGLQDKQQEALSLFWQSYFNDSGAVEVIRRDLP